MKFAVVVFPGSNCDRDTKHAIEQMGHDCHIVWHKEKSLPEDVKCVILPGGFSYGDYLRSGAIARFSPIMNAVTNVANEGGLVLGICNGFQVLVECGLLPGALMKNKKVKFICNSQLLEVKK